MHINYECTSIINGILTGYKWDIDGKNRDITVILVLKLYKYRYDWDIIGVLECARGIPLDILPYWDTTGIIGKKHMVCFGKAPLNIGLSKDCQRHAKRVWS
jgi:hypothetical protein